VNHLNDFFNPIELTDVELLRVFESLKNKNHSSMRLVYSVSNELLNRGWQKTDTEEWSWKR
jgi:hypothetical protein